MEIQIETMRDKLREVLEDQGLERGQASCYADKWIDELKDRKEPTLIPADMFQRIFGNMRGIK